MFENILTNLIGQAPWTAIIVIILYFIYRELKRSDEILAKEMRESMERISREMKESDERIIKEVKEEIRRMGIAVFGIQEAVFGLMSGKGVLNVEESNYLKITTKNFLRVVGISLNPITKKEWEKLNELVDIEVTQMTHEEALELYDLAYKFALENMDKIGVYTLFTYAVVMKYLTLKKGD